MSAILGFFLIVIVIVFVIGFSLISGILRLLFGFGRKQHYYSGRKNGSPRDDSQNNNTHQSSSGYNDPTSRKKIFGDDEGEYVDFEEVKEDNK